MTHRSARCSISQRRMSRRSSPRGKRLLALRLHASAHAPLSPSIFHSVCARGRVAYARRHARRTFGRAASSWAEELGKLIFPRQHAGAAWGCGAKSCARATKVIACLRVEWCQSQERVVKSHRRSEGRERVECRLHDTDPDVRNILFSTLCSHTALPGTA